MDDELNIDPRETDYLDHIDMGQAINFYELRTQLADLGFNEDVLLNELRSMVTTNTEKRLHDIFIQQDGVDFALSFEKKETSGYQLYCIDASMDIPGEVNNQVM
jgi:uncharacterized protein YpiB (UPF0302 family)